MNYFTHAYIKTVFGKLETLRTFSANQILKTN